MEYLDVYDENNNFMGIKSRDYVHQNALWHKTVHCWLYDRYGNIYFQLRTDEGKMYTTASGHVLSGESIKEAFGREVKEEIGIDILYDAATLVDVYIFKLDKKKSDGSMFRDRAFSNVYVCLYDGDDLDFDFDLDEVCGVVKVSAKKVLELFKGSVSDIESSVIEVIDCQKVVSNKIITKEDFLLNKGEVLQEKYGAVLEKVVSLTEKK